MVSVGNAASTGFKALAFAALNKFDTLNSIVNALSAGKVNRDTLAQSVLRGALQLGTEVAVANKTLGERSAQLVPLARDAVIDNDLGRMKSAVEGLVKEGLGTLMDKDSGSLLAQIGKGMLEQVASKTASKLGETLVGDHAVEKLVATLVKEHGWKPLEDYLNKNLEGYTGGRFIAGQVKAILQRTMVDKSEFDQRDNPEFKLMAGVLKEYLSGEADYLKPLRDYAPTLVSVGETVHHFATERVPQGIDSLQRVLVGEPSSVDVHQAYSKQIENAKNQPPEDPLPPPLLPTELSDKTRERDVADKLVQHLVVGEITGKSTVDTEEVQKVIDEVHDQGKLSDEHHQALTELVDVLSPEQIKPLGDRGEISVAHNWSGRLDRIETASHSITDLGDDMAEATRGVLTHAPTETTLVSGYRVAEGYGRRVDELDLELVPSDQGTTGQVVGKTVDVVNAGVNTLWWALGYDTSSTPSYSESSELRDLYNTCGQNEAVMHVVSRYLDPDLARQALVSPVISRMQDSNTGLFGTSGGTQLQLKDPENPHYRFVVRQEAPDLFMVSMEARWDITGFGSDPEHLRKPEGSTESHMVTSATLMIRLNGEDGAPTVKPYPMGVVATVNNVVEFDLTSGRKL